MKITDLNKREILIFAPLVIIVIWMGVYPAPFLEAIDASVANLVKNYQGALAVAAETAMTTASK